MEAEGDERAEPLACLARALIADIAADCETELVELGRIVPGTLNDATQSLADWLRSTSLQHLGRMAEACEAAEASLARAMPVHAPVVASTRLQARWYLGHADEVLAGLPLVVERAGPSAYVTRRR